MLFYKNVFLNNLRAFLFSMSFEDYYGLSYSKGKITYFYENLTIVPFTSRCTDAIKCWTFKQNTL